MISKIFQVRLNSNYLEKINYIKKILKKNKINEEELNISFILKYCINNTFEEMKNNERK